MERVYYVNNDILGKKELPVTLNITVGILVGLDMPLIFTILKRLLPNGTT